MRDIYKNKEKTSVDKLIADIMVLVLWAVAAAASLVAYTLISGDSTAFVVPESSPHPLVGWIVAALASATAIRALWLMFRDPVMSALQHLKK